MRDTLRYQEIGSSRKYQQPEPKSTTFIIEIKGKQCHVNNASQRMFSLATYKSSGNR